MRICGARCLILVRVFIYIYIYSFVQVSIGGSGGSPDLLLFDDAIIPNSRAQAYLKISKRFVSYRVNKIFDRQKGEA